MTKQITLRFVLAPWTAEAHNQRFVWYAPSCARHIYFRFAVSQTGKKYNTWHL
jgi:hypothetical protein